MYCGQFCLINLINSIFEKCYLIDYTEKILVPSAFPCQCKALGVWAEGFWIRGDLRGEVKWWERHPVCKVS